MVKNCSGFAQDGLKRCFFRSCPDGPNVSLYPVHTVPSRTHSAAHYPTPVCKTRGRCSGAAAGSTVSLPVAGPNLSGQHQQHTNRHLWRWSSRDGVGWGAGQPHTVHTLRGDMVVDGKLECDRVQLCPAEMGAFFFSLSVSVFVVRSRCSACSRYFRPALRVSAPPTLTAFKCFRVPLPLEFLTSL